MTDTCKIGDKVMYQAESREPQAGNITDITYNENGEPEQYVVRLVNEQIIACSADELAHYDLNKL